MVKVVSAARRADAVRCIGCGINDQLQRGYSCRAQIWPWRLIVMDRKVPDEEEKKNPTKKKSSSGCHNPFLIYAHPL